MKKRFFKKISLLSLALMIGLFGLFPMTAYADDSDPDLVMVDSGKNPGINVYVVKFQSEAMSLSVTEMYVNDQKITQVFDNGSSTFVNNTYYVKPAGFLEPKIWFKVNSLAIDDEVKFKNGNGTYVYKVINPNPGFFGKLLDHNPTLIQDTKYTIQVNHGVAQFEGNEVTEIEEGKTVTLVADTPEANYHFRNWKVETDGVTVEDENAATTTFTMPEKDVAFTALYTKQVNVSLADWQYGDEPSQPVYGDPADMPDDLSSVEMKYKGIGSTTYAEQSAAPTQPGTYHLSMAYTKITDQGETKYYEAECDFEITKRTLDIRMEDMDKVLGETIPLDEVMFAFEGAIEADMDTIAENIQVAQASQVYFDQEDPLPVGVYTINLEKVDNPVWNNYNVQLHDGKLVVREPEVVNYVVLSGADQSLLAGSPAEKIVINGDFNKFLGVWVDGKKLTSGTDYTAISGSTIVTFSKNFLDSLTVGTHQVLFKYNDGEVGTTLTIREKDGNNGNNTGINTGSNNGNQKDTIGKAGTVNKVNADSKDPSAKTGDDFAGATGLLLLVLSAVALVGLRKKQFFK